jgi:hypothetical protein
VAEAPTVKPVQSTEEFDVFLDSLSLHDGITNNLFAVPSVEKVFVGKSKSMVRVWTVVDDPPEEVFDAIYDREKSIIHQFNHERFDFTVVTRKGRDISSFMSMDCPGWATLSLCAKQDPTFGAGGRKRAAR